MKNFRTTSIVICFALIAFLYSQEISSQGWNYGKNKYNIKVDGVDREFYVHIPKSYKDGTKVPLVFMLHGTSGDGEQFYNNSGWSELSETEDFVAVFPSSLRLKINDNGELKTITKWNTIPDADWSLQPGEVAYDDIKFLRIIIDQIQAALSIDSERIYLNGFSNGGSMAAKCSIEMSDVLAAVCSNAAGFYLDTTYIPKRKIPFLFQIGNLDYGPGNVGPGFPAVPMNFFDTLISTPGLSFLNGKHYRIANNAVRNFDLKSEHTQIIGDTNFAVLTTYYPLDEKDSHEFKYIFVKDLGHFYPNWAPTEHWKWLKKFSLNNNGTIEKGTKIRIVTSVENTDREYYIHLPAQFDSTQKVPLVMFFHGGGQDGNLYYNHSGWNQVADTANFIVVYPSSLSYCVVEDGKQSYNPQWNIEWTAGATFCPNQVLKDDLLFVQTILQNISARYKIDQNRIYAVGFSNGGEFTAKCSIELSDKIAATVSCGGGGSLPRDTVLVPNRKLPVMQMFGNKDERMLIGLNTSGAVPMGFQQLYTAFPALYGRQVTPYVNAFELDENNVNIIGDTNSVVTAIFKGKSNLPENSFYLVEVKNLIHEYPNGINHPFHAATYHWRWMNHYTLDNTTGNKDVSYNRTPIHCNPNPASYFIQLNEINYYHIYNAQGVLVYKGTANRIDITNWSNGIYWIKSDRGIGRFIKE